MEDQGRFLGITKYAATGMYTYTVAVFGRAIKISSTIGNLSRSEVIERAKVEYYKTQSPVVINAPDFAPAIPQSGEVTLEMNDAAMESLYLNFDLNFIGCNLESLQTIHLLLGQLITFQTQK